MNVKGSHTFDVSRERLWAYLMDPDVLAKITPGVTKLEVLAPETFQSVSDIKIGPVKGSFKGKLKVVDKNEPESFAIEMEQLSKIGNAHVKVHMNLGEVQDGKSELNFDGKAKLSGVIARTGQRVLSGVANTITKEVFASLAKHIEEDKATSAHSETTNIEKTTKVVKQETPPTPKIEETHIDHKPKVDSSPTTIDEPIIEKQDNAYEKPIETSNKTIKQEHHTHPTGSGFWNSIFTFFKNLFS